MNKYQDGKIYLIYSKKYPLIYYGSTTRTLEDRLKEHERDCELFLNEKGKYTSSFEIIKLGNYDILLIEDFPCNSKKDLLRREGEYIKQNFCLCVNKKIAGRTNEEYVNDNREKISKRQQRWSENNKERVAKSKREWKSRNKYKINCPHCNKLLAKLSIDRHIKNSCPNRPIT
jgi:hypothetical protein